MNFLAISVLSLSLLSENPPAPTNAVISNWSYLISTPLDLVMEAPGVTYTFNGITNLSNSGIMQTISTNGRVYQYWVQPTNVLPAQLVGFNQGTLSSNVNAFMPKAWTGKNSTSVYLDVFAGANSQNGSGFNSTCWLNPTNFSGQTFFTTVAYWGTLITPYNAVHSADSGLWPVGTAAYFEETNGTTVYTNWVMSDTNVYASACVVTFSNACPSSVVPFQIPPTNYFQHITSLTNTYFVFVRRNTSGTANPVVVTGTAYNGTNFVQSIPTNICPLWASNNVVLASGGDSGCPLFEILPTGQPIYWGECDRISGALALWGPLICNPVAFPYFQAACGTNQISVMSTNGLTLF